MKFSHLKVGEHYIVRDHARNNETIEVRTKIHPVRLEWAETIFNACAPGGFVIREDEETDVVRIKN